MRRTGVCVVVALTVLIAGCGGGAGSSAPPARPSTTPSERLPSYVVAKVFAGQKPCAVEGGFGSVWVSLYGENVELRVDPTTRKVLARIKTGFSPCGIAVGGGAVWVENYAGNSVTRIDPRTNTPRDIPVGTAPYDVTYAAGAAWVTNYDDDTVSRVDARTDKTTTIKVGTSPVGIAPAGGAVWVTNMGDGSVDRIDPATLDVRTAKLPVRPSWTAWGHGQLWVSSKSALVRLDPATGRRVAAVRLGGGPNDGDVTDGTVWVPDAGGHLDGVDPGTNRLLGRWATGLADPFVLAGWAGKLWLVDFQGTALEEIDPAALR